MRELIRSRLLAGSVLGQLEYLYQPIFDIRRARFSKVELLVRLRGPDRTYFDSEKLLQEAGRLGLARAIDKNGFRVACQSISRLMDMGIERISVNLAPDSCQDPDLVAEAGRIMAETGASAEHICVEVTEMEQIKDEAGFARSVRRLYDMGLEIAIDDFGKGYSGIQRMLTIPFHDLKLDKELISNLETLPLSKPLLGTIVDFAHEQGITVTAEGVEHEGQRTSMTLLGCDYLQGYYYSRPVGLEELERVVRGQRVCS